jgi:hypothetical protein
MDRTGHIPSSLTGFHLSFISGFSNYTDFQKKYFPGKTDIRIKKHQTEKCFSGGLQIPEF